jgi:hypothetical protein
VLPRAFVALGSLSLSVVDYVISWAFIFPSVYSLFSSPLSAVNAVDPRKLLADANSNLAVCGNSHSLSEPYLALPLQYLPQSIRRPVASIGVSWPHVRRNSLLFPYHCLKSLLVRQHQLHIQQHQLIRYVKAKKAKTYNSGYSLVVTHLTTNPPVRCLNRAERTGSLVFNVLWSYVEFFYKHKQYIDWFSTR